MPKSMEMESFGLQAKVGRSWTCCDSHCFRVGDPLTLEICHDGDCVDYHEITHCLGYSLVVYYSPAVLSTNTAIPNQHHNRD